jgi:hypothetical protein
MVALKVEIHFISDYCSCTSTRGATLQYSSTRVLVLEYSNCTRITELLSTPVLVHLHALLLDDSTRVL